MIKVENYGGGIRWHCTNCDTNASVPGSTIKHISWTNGPAPKFCTRCEPHQEYTVMLDLSLLLPHGNTSRVREAITRDKELIAQAVVKALEGRDGKLNFSTVSYARNARR